MYQAVTLVSEMHSLSRDTFDGKVPVLLMTASAHKSSKENIIPVKAILISRSLLRRPILGHLMNVSYSACHLDLRVLEFTALSDESEETDGQSTDLVPHGLADTSKGALVCDTTF